MTSSNSFFAIYPGRVVFHPRRWLWVWPLCPGSAPFALYFQLAIPCPDRIRLPPVTRTVLPSLIEFHFQGASKYLDDLVSRIDAPQLDRIYTSYLNQLVDFQVAQLPMFIDRSVGPKLTPSMYARVTFYDHLVTFRTYLHANDSSPSPSYATTNVFCHDLDWQVSRIAQLVSHFSEIFSNVVRLKLEARDRIQLEGTDDVEWLHPLHQLPTMQTLHVSRQLAEHVTLALGDIAW